MAGPWEVMPEPGSAHHLMMETSVAGPLGGDAGAQKRPPPYVEDVNGRPLERQCRSPGVLSTLC
jgi:hypothetical protein